MTAPDCLIIHTNKYIIRKFKKASKAIKNEKLFRNVRTTGYKYIEILDMILQLMIDDRNIRCNLSINEVMQRKHEARALFNLISV